MTKDLYSAVLSEDCIETGGDSVWAGCNWSAKMRLQRWLFQNVVHTDGTATESTRLAKSVLVLGMASNGASGGPAVRAARDRSHFAVPI